MADKWGGPVELVTIKGLVDSAEVVESGYKDAEGQAKKQVKLSLVDVVLTNSDGSERVPEGGTYTLFVPNAGKGSNIFYASIRRLSPSTPADDILTAVEGKVVTFAFSRDEITLKDGKQVSMRIYAVAAIGEDTTAVEPVEESVVLALLQGKTPAEVARVRAQYPPFTGDLASRLAVQKKWPEVGFEDGKYRIV